MRSHVKPRTERDHNHSQAFSIPTLTIIVIYQEESDTAPLMSTATPKRQACDRCYGQKLRCNRKDEDSVCMRCQKSGAPCTTGPSLRSMRPKRTRATQSRALVVEPQRPLPDSSHEHFDTGFDSNMDQRLGQEEDCIQEKSYRQGNDKENEISGQSLAITCALIVITCIWCPGMADDPMAQRAANFDQTMDLDWMANPFQKSNNFDLSLSQSFSGIDSFFDMDTTKSGRKDGADLPQPELPPAATDSRTGNQIPSSLLQASRNPISSLSTVQLSGSRNLPSQDPGMDSSDNLNLFVPGSDDVLGSFLPSPLTQGSSTDNPDDPESSRAINFWSQKSSSLQMRQSHEKSGPTNDKGYWIKRLTNLNLKLFEHSDAIPAVELHNLQDSAASFNGNKRSPVTDPTSPDKPKEVHVDTSFRHSQGGCYRSFFSYPKIFQARRGFHDIHSSVLEFLNLPKKSNANSEI